MDNCEEIQSNYLRRHSKWQFIKKFVKLFLDYKCLLEIVDFSQGSQT